jgi:hypothetical protein
MFFYPGRHYRCNPHLIQWEATDWEKLREEARKLYKEGWGQTEIAKKLNSSPGTVHGWVEDLITRDEPCVENKCAHSLFKLATKALQKDLNLSINGLATDFSIVGNSLIAHLQHEHPLLWGKHQEAKKKKCTKDLCIIDKWKTYIPHLADKSISIKSFAGKDAATFALHLNKYHSAWLEDRLYTGRRKKKNRPIKPARSTKPRCSEDVCISNAWAKLFTESKNSGRISMLPLAPKGGTNIARRQRSFRRHLKLFHKETYQKLKKIKVSRPPVLGCKLAVCEHSDYAPAILDLNNYADAGVPMKVIEAARKYGLVSSTTSSTKDSKYLAFFNHLSKYHKKVIEKQKKLLRGKCSGKLCGHPNFKMATTKLINDKNLGIAEIATDPKFYNSLYRHLVVHHPQTIQVRSGQRSIVSCGQCHLTGHNKRTCPEINKTLITKSRRS